MARIDLERVAETFVQAFNENNLEQLATLLADSLIHDELDTPFRATAREDSMRRFREIKYRAPEVRATVQSWIIDEDRNVAVGRFVWRLSDRDDRLETP